MERLTRPDLKETCYDPWELCGMDHYCAKNGNDEGGCYHGCHIVKMYKKLAEYEDLEDQGKILKPKCKPGDIVFAINKSNHTISEFVVGSISYDTNHMFHYVFYEPKSGICKGGFLEYEIGYTVFLTREEALRALGRE